MSAELAALAERLRGLHHEDAPLILPNAWDVASAVMVERVGAKAVATSSSAVAASLGYPDGEVMPVDEMFAAVGRIAAAVSLPVSADIEAGYGLGAGEIVERLITAGAVGMNIEDTDRTHGAQTLVSVDRQAERIATIRTAADEARVPLMINARIDVFLRGAGTPAEHTAEAINRGRRYLSAGADGIFPIWLTDADLIGQIVREVAGPVNVLLRPGAPSIAALSTLGVRRISVGGGLARHALLAAESVARQLLAGDSTSFAEVGEGQDQSPSARKASTSSS